MTEQRIARIWIVEFDEGDGWTPVSHIGATDLPAPTFSGTVTRGREYLARWRARYPFPHWRFRVTRYILG